MRLVCISDTHNQLGKVRLPRGDLLIHAGDWTMRGSILEVAQFAHELKNVAYGFKYGALVIAGNHDWLAQKDNKQVRYMLKDADIRYLLDQEVVINGLKFWGSPWSPWFNNWAFNLERGEDIRKQWDFIPKDTDVLVTHGPAQGFRDELPHGQHVGCEELRDVLAEVQPKAHVFGHIHNSYGVSDYNWDNGTQTKMVNAAICNEQYKPTNEPIVVEL